MAHGLLLEILLKYTLAFTINDNKMYIINLRKCMLFPMLKSSYKHSEIINITDGTSKTITVSVLS